MKNVKIAVTADQPLEQIVRGLERLGYREDHVSKLKTTFVITWNFGLYDIQSMDDYKLVGHPNTITLAELKEMRK